MFSIVSLYDSKVCLCVSSLLHGEILSVFNIIAWSSAGHFCTSLKLDLNFLSSSLCFSLYLFPFSLQPFDVHNFHTVPERLAQRSPSRHASQHFCQNHPVHCTGALLALNSAKNASYVYSTL